MRNRLVVSLFSLVSAVQMATADTRVIVDTAPTPDEFAEMLGINMDGASTSETPKLRMRGIKMRDEAAATNPVKPVGSIVATPINFALDSAEIPTNFEPYLDNLAVVLKSPGAQKRTLTISGHTDSLGTEVYNFSLSQRRAAAVESYLVARGVRADQLVSFGKGESELVEGREADHHVNRRVEFRVTQ